MPLSTEGTSSRPASRKPSSHRAIEDSRQRDAECGERHAYTKRNSREGDPQRGPLERESKTLPPKGEREDVKREEGLTWVMQDRERKQALARATQTRF